MGAKKTINKLLICSILFILIASLLPMLGEAYTSVQVFGPRCLGDGRFSFTVVNRLGDPLLLNDTQILMTHRDLGTFPVQGAWDKESVYPGTTSSEIAVFTSTTGNLNESGSYGGVFSYEGCRQQPCQELFRIEHCNEFRYSCDLERLAIDRCFISKGALRLRFSGLNAGQHEHQDAERGLAISLDSNSRTIRKSIHIDGMTLRQEGPDRYTLQIPLLPQEQLFEVDLQPWKCKDGPIRDAERCILQAKPLVDRKLNASIENRDMASSPTLTRQAIPTTAVSREDAITQDNRNRTMDPLPFPQPEVETEQIASATEETASRSETSLDEERKETRARPSSKRTATASKDLSRFSPQTTAFLIALGAIWLIAIIIILVLLSKRR